MSKMIHYVSKFKIRMNRSFLQINNPGVLDVQFVGEYNMRGKLEPVCESKFEFICDFISFVS